MEAKTGRLARSFERVRRQVRSRRCARQCARQIDALADRDGLIVTAFYDVEGNYAREGATASEIESVGRILEIENRHGIRSTYNIVARLALDTPQLVAAIRAAGNEIASHSYDHSILTRLGRTALGANLRETTRTFEDLGVTIRGHRSPQSAWDGRVLDALLAGGYAWSAENGPEPYPYRIRERDGKALWRFPVAADDWQYESERLSPGRMLERWRRQVEEARGRRSHLALGFHPWVEASPDRLSVLEEFFHWLAEQDEIEVMPFGDVLRLLDASAAPELAVAHG